MYKKIIFYYIIIVTLSTCLLEASSVYNDNCKGCHASIFELSDTHTKKQWRELTREPKTMMRYIHKDNLDVISYLNSKKYNADNLCNDMAFYAPQKSSKTVPLKKYTKTDQPSRYCIQCHNSEMILATKRTFDKWNVLYKSDESLKLSHKQQIKVLDYIDSSIFKKGKNKLIEDIKFYAPNPKIIKLKNGRYALTLQYDGATSKHAKDLLDKIESSFDGCALDQDVDLSLSFVKDDSSQIGVMASMITLGLVPMQTKAKWELKAKYKNQIFRNFGETSSELGWFYAKEKKIDDIFAQMINNIIKDMNLQCKK